MAAELIQRRVNVLLLGPGTQNDVKELLPADMAVVFMAAGDPIRMGLVTSLSRPGGNLTGVSIMAGDLNAKRFGLFRDLVPKARVIGVREPWRVALEYQSKAAGLDSGRLPDIGPPPSWFE